MTKQKYRYTLTRTEEMGEEGETEFTVAGYVYRVKQEDDFNFIGMAESQLKEALRLYTYTKIRTLIKRSEKIPRRLSLTLIVDNK